MTARLAFERAVRAEYKPIRAHEIAGRAHDDAAMRLDDAARAEPNAAKRAGSPDEQLQNVVWPPTNANGRL